MKVAVPASSAELTAQVEARFARAPVFLVFDTASETWEILENTRVLNAVQGAGIQAAETLVRHGIDVVLTTHCGPKAFRALQAAGVPVYLGVAGPVGEAVRSLLAGALSPATEPDVEGHW